MAGDIGEFALDARGDFRQQRDRAGIAMIADKAARPIIDDAFGIMIFPFDRPKQVGHVFRRISEGKEAGIGFNVHLLLRERGMIQCGFAIDDQLRSPRLECGDGDGIAEDVMQPAQFAGRRIDVEACGQQALVKCPRGRIMMRCSPRDTGC